MYDVNPLGPLTHLKEIERQALALQAASARGRPGVFAAASAWVMRLLKRLGVSPGSNGVSAGGSMNVSRR